VWLNAQLHDDDVAALHGLPPVRERAHRARLVLDGYGLSTADRRRMVERVIEFAIREPQLAGLHDVSGRLEPAHEEGSNGCNQRGEAGHE
jgi:hypothetical protein